MWASSASFLVVFPSNRNAMAYPHRIAGGGPTNASPAPLPAGRCKTKAHCAYAAVVRWNGELCACVGSGDSRGYCERADRVRRAERVTAPRADGSPDPSSSQWGGSPTAIGHHPAPQLSSSCAGLFARARPTAFIAARRKAGDSPALRARVRE